MIKRTPGTQGPTDAEIADVRRWEYDSLKDFFTRMAVADNLWQSVEQLVLARSPREIVVALQAHPALLTDRGSAALELVEIFVTTTQMPFAPAVLADRRAWIKQMRTLNDA